MKKSTIGALIAAAVLIIGGVGLFVGGLISIGGLEAANRVLNEHGIEIFDELDIDFDEGDFDIDIDSGRVRIDMDF